MQVFEIFNNKNIGDYHDLCVQSDTLLFADVFENFRNKYIEIYGSFFLSALGLGWKACLKKNEIKFELLTDIDMLLMVKKEIIGGMCHEIHRYVEANNKYMK